MIEFTYQDPPIFADPFLSAVIIALPGCKSIHALSSANQSSEFIPELSISLNISPVISDTFPEDGVGVKSPAIFGFV